jgi:hypothetical protein
VSDNDGMSFSTQVPAVKCAWVPTVQSYHARHLMPPEELALVALLVLKAPVWLLGT